MATYAIGDLHGCYDELMQLLEKIKYNPQNDTLWFTGDLINGGPKPAEVIRFIKSQKPETICILGNHDITLLSAAAGKITAPKDRRIGYEPILQAPDCAELVEWLRHQPLTYYSEEFDSLLVHAGILPIWDLATAQQLGREVEAHLRSPDHLQFYSELWGDMPTQWHNNLQGLERIRLIINCLTRMRFCNATGAINLSVKGGPSNTPAGFQPWFKIPNPHIGNTKIIFGHWAALLGNTGMPNIYAIDTGCVWGAELTALRLEDHKLFHVPSTQPKVNWTD